VNAREEELKMKTKSLWRVSVATTLEAEGAVAEWLGALLNRAAACHLNAKTGACTVSVFRRRNPGKGVRGKISAGLKRIQSCGLKIAPGKISITKVRREDWTESWKRHFQPIEIVQGRARHSVRAPSNSLLIKPSWSKRRPRRGQAVVVLDPGLSFGTGQHPTTAFCLREIVRGLNLNPVAPPLPRRTTAQRCRRRQIKNSRTPSFLDIGTGSGILAIAAARLGYSPVDAFDFDADAVRIARANARKNGIAGKVRLWRGDVTRLPLRPAQRYDWICANLTADQLLAARRHIAAQLNRGGTLALAGILKQEFELVQKAFTDLGWKRVCSEIQGEWRSGLFRSTRKVSCDF